MTQVKHIYSSVDIGSDSIKIVVCELFKNKLNLLAASSVKSKGIKKGLITDIEAASVSLKKAVNEVEEMLGIKIKKIMASIPSYFAEFTVINGEVNISSEDLIITGEDIINVLQDGMHNKQNSTREMVTIIPIDFTVDDKTGIKEPKGLVGSKLKARAVMVTTPKKNIYSVVSLIENIGIEVVDISLNSIGDIYAFKTKEMDDQIGAVINIGAETTSVSLYNKGIIVKNSMIQLGGKNIDNDIAYMYKIDVQTAFKMKEKFALAHKMYANVSDIYEVSTSDKEVLKINQFEVSEIVMARIEEILTLAKKEIGILTSKQIDYVVITGGVSNMTHFEYIADQIFGKFASIGNVRLVGIRNNKYSSAVGNIVYFINKLKLKGQDYSMVSDSYAEELSSTKKNIVNISNDSMLGKVFGYFFGE